MKTEFLKSLNLSQEVIDKIMAENGKDIAVEQKKAEKVIQERDSYKLKAESLETQVNDANTEIQKFKDMDIDGIKKQRMTGKRRQKRQRPMRINRFPR